MSAIGPGRREIDAHAGPHEPLTTSFLRQPDSLRRTTSIDVTSPEGFEADLYVDARGRDIWTDEHGNAHVRGTAMVTIRVERWSAVIKELSVRPHRAGFAELVEQSARRGFRHRLKAVAADLELLGDLRFQLLDDFGVALISAAYPALHTGIKPPLAHRAARVSGMSDVCAGWSSDSWPMITMSAMNESLIPAVAPIPPATDEQPDALGWHEMPTLVPESTRRVRRIDIARSDTGFAVDTFFRDSYADAELHQSALHEYRVRADVDPAGEVVLDAEADPRVLPWLGCPAAAGSAARLKEQPLREFRDWVPQSLTGVSTCTHLNDTFRALADVPKLIALIGRWVPTS